MAETQVREDTSFGTTDFIYSVKPGYVLVKSNFFTGSIKARGKYSKKSEISYLFFQDAERGFLERLLRKFASTKPDVADMIRKELEYRDKKGTPDEIPLTSELLNAKIAVKNGTPAAIIARRFNAKYGIKFRWPWQSILMLSTAEKKIDTPVQHVDTASSVCLSVDTDYRYHIVDPNVYAKCFNSLAGAAGAANKSSAAFIEDLVGEKLDSYVREYVRTKDYTFFQNRANLNLTKALHGQLLKEGLKYGIEITDVVITDVKLPEDIIKARQDAIAAKERAKAMEIEAEGKRKKIEIEAEGAKKRIELEGEGKAKAQTELLKQIFNELGKYDGFNKLDGESKKAFIERVLAFSSSANVVYLAGNPGKSDASLEQIIALLAAKDHIDLGRKTPSVADIEIECDEYGFLSSEASKEVLRLRGEAFEGTLIKKADLTPEEITELKKYYASKDGDSKKR